MTNKNNKQEKEKDVVRAVDSLLQSWYERNNEFNSAFDNDKVIKIKSRIKDRSPYEISPSAALFWVERSTYDEELLRWQSEAAEKNRRVLLPTINARSLEPHLLQLKTQVERQRVVPFVGAGVSSYCCPGSSEPLFPLWTAAIEQIASRVSGLTGAKKQQYADAIKSGNTTTASQILWEADENQVTAYIRSTFDKSKSENSGIYGPAKLLQPFSSGCVVTTNYDSVLEQSIGGFSLVHAGRDHNTDIATRIASGDKCLIKLHGDSSRKETYVFAQSHYSEAYKDSSGEFDFTKPLPRSLRQLYANQSLLFLGCSLEDDLTIKLFEHVIRDESLDVPEHFAILPSPSSDRARNKKASRLNGLNIRPIWYPPNKHNYVALYLQLVLDLANGNLTQL